MWKTKYKNKITYVIIALLMTVLSVGVLTGCGRNSDEKVGTSEKSAVMEALPGKDIGEEKSDGLVSESAEEAAADKKPSEPGMTGSGSSEEEETADEELAEETELDWITLEEMLRPSVLRITCGAYEGSGVVWEITEDEVRVVSSGHLLKYGETCEVECYAGIYYEAEVERVLGDCDIGFAVFPAKALQEDEVELTAVIPSARNAEELIQGEELAVYGSMDYAAGNFVKGYLIEAEREMQLEGYGSAENLLLGGIQQEKSSAGIESQNSEKDGADHYDTAGSNEKNEEIPEKGLVDAGMSGSGVFDRQGHLLGILAGGDGKEGFAAVPVWRFTEQ